MSKYIYLPENGNELPLIDKELIYADISSICFRSKTQLEIPYDYQNIIRFYRSVKTEGTYPRFNVSDYCYTIKPDYNITPLPNLTNMSNYEFDDLTDRLSLELKEKLKLFKRVYVFWSGGIDSTLILSAIFKNWSKEDLKYLTVICNDVSINEYTSFYNKFIRDTVDTISSNLFFKNELSFDEDCIYVTGDAGDTIAGYAELETFNSLYPNIYNNSYKAHSKELIEYFGGGQIGYYSYKRIVQSFQQQKIEIETVFDFLWWIEFNWAYSLEIFYILWSYSLLPEHLDTKTFMTSNVFNWFGDIRYQHWALRSIGTNRRIQRTIESFKYSYKKYIYDFDQDLEYFLYKKRIGSIPKSRSIHHGKKVVAVDTDWNLYYC